MKYATTAPLVIALYILTLWIQNDILTTAPHPTEVFGPSVNRVINENCFWPLFINNYNCEEMADEWNRLIKVNKCS